MFRAIKEFFIFVYHFLFIDQTRGHISHTKFWSNVGYFTWCVLFPYAVMFGSKINYELWLIFGAVVIGNRSLNKYLETRQTGLINNSSSQQHNNDTGPHTWHDRKRSIRQQPRVDDLINDDNIPTTRR